MTEPDQRASLLAALAAFLEPEIRAWRGEAPLAAVFWLYGVLASIMFGILYARSVVLGQYLLEQVLILLLCVYAVWMPVALWRCAQHSKSPWSVPARWLSLAWGMNAFFLLMFRELDLIALYLAR